jgi:hypothetical protein
MVRQSPTDLVIEIRQPSGACTDPKSSGVEFSLWRAVRQPVRAGAGALLVTAFSKSCHVEVAGGCVHLRG